MIIATAGHVDHGKTLLVHALTGIETDRLEEEKDRGLTIDLGFAYIDDELGGRLGFIDVPGHIKFINNMLAGVGAIDYALIVVAADDGPMPQTLEHLAILDQLGIAAGAVALTKIDRVDPGRVDEVKGQISKLLENTCLANAAIYPLSSITGEGIEDLKETLCIVASETDSQATTGHFRLAIDRCFSVKGSGLVVTGSVFAGEIRAGDELFLAPQGETVRVRNIHTQNQPSTHAKAGDRCAINLSVHNLKREDISRGNWLTSNPDQQATARFDLSLKVLASESKALRHWTPVHVHTAANHVTGRVATLDAGAIAPGDDGLVQLVTNEPINVCFGDKVIIRDQGADRTIAGGVVIDPYSPKRGRNKAERIEYLRCLTGLKPQAALHIMLNQARAGLSLKQCMGSLNFKLEEIDAELVDEKVEIYGDTIITSANLSFIKKNLLTQFEQWHEHNPQAKGLSLNQLSQFLPRKFNIVEVIVKQLVAANELIMAGNTFQRPGFSLQLSTEAEVLWVKVEPILARNRTKPPVLHDLAKELAIEPKSLEKLLGECLQTGLLVRPVANRYFLPVAMQDLTLFLSSAADGSDFTVKEYRDATGIGRNLCIEILEYFDRQGITRRLGDKRTIIN